MDLRAIMHSPPVTIAPEEPVVTAARRMREDNVGCLVVTNSGAVQGVITDRDVTVRCVSEGHNPQDCAVSSHMSSPVITATPAMDALEAIHVMTEQQIKRLPLVDNSQLLGLVSQADIARALDRPVHDLLLGVAAHRRAA